MSRFPEPLLTAALVPLHFTTENFPPCEQFSVWQQHMAPLLDVHLPDNASAEGGFIVQQAVWNLGGVLLVQQSAPPFHYERSWDKVRFSPIDHWQITFLHSGHSWTGVEGNIVENEPGTVEVRSLGQPFRGRATATDSVSLIIPIDHFADRGGLPPASSNVVLGGHRAKMLIDFVSSLEASLHQLTNDELPSTKDSFREIIFDTIAPLVWQSGTNDQISQIGLMTRARRFIQSNLASHDLTPDALSKELAISRTRLYEMFESSGGVLNYIRQQRLSAAHAMLIDISDTRKITDVAAALGFDSAANFSRAFTQQFGYSPSNVRKMSCMGGVHIQASSDQSTKLTFEVLLRTLGLVL
ncbi:helix-turn-helix transcriptional regulator [Falsochrobactrum shanghaiense]|nr:AraC family transcriptional regulator [Falsochrobactrum shanghaiense]